MQKSMGIVRRIDELGRITLERADRKLLGLEAKAKVEMLRVGKRIILQKFTGICEICGNKVKESDTEIEGKLICKNCIKKVSEIKNKN